MIDQHTDFFKYVDNFAKTAHIPSIPIFESKLEYIPEITIAIPTYKRADLLKEAIDSAINQVDYFNYDIIVVDNNPERGCETEKLMMSYNNPKISYYKNAENLGMAGNFNRLFTLAKGRYVVMLHDDDLLESYYLIKLNEILSKVDHEPNAIFFNHSIINKKEKYRNKNSLYALNIKPSDFLFGCVVSFIGGCFNRTTVLLLGGFSDDFYPSLDYHFFVRLSKQGKFYSITGYPFAKYRILENESMKTETILNTLVMDNKIKKSILSKNSIIYSLLFKIVFKVSDYQYLNNMSISFNNNDIKLKNKILELKNKITLLDRIIYRVIIRFRSLILHLRKYKIS